MGGGCVWWETIPLRKEIGTSFQLHQQDADDDPDNLTDTADNADEDAQRSQSRLLPEFGERHNKALT